MRRETEKQMEKADLQAKEVRDNMQNGIDWSKLDEVLLAGPPVLFLGAGFSHGAINKANAGDGKGIKKIIIEKLFRNDADREELEEMNLKEICEEAYRSNRKAELISLLTDCFRNTTFDKHNPYHQRLVEYPWKVIYSVNIDDLVENIYRSKEKNLIVWHKREMRPRDEKATELIKLHGCVNYPEEGYIFAQREYTDLITDKLDAKLNEFTNDILNKNVVFVGASLDEPDIDYYLTFYYKAGYSRKNTNNIIFIDPKPSRALRGRVSDLGAILIEATSEDFINHAADLKYNPSSLEKARIQLNYSGIHRLADIEKTFDNPYDSKLYRGDYCKWQDVSEGWIFEDKNFQNARKALNIILRDKTSDMHCFSIFGGVFSGKSCLIKKLAYELLDRGFEILEFNGDRFDYNPLLNYINESASKRIALIVDNASFYYERIEKLLHKRFPGKIVVVLTASREYYHKRKRYYLEGNSFYDYRQDDLFTEDDARNIRETLDNKTRLSYMTTWEKKLQVKEILRLRSVSNLIVGLTYGGLVKNTGNELIKCIKNLGRREKKLLLELAIFDAIEVGDYPIGLFAERYGTAIDFHHNGKELTRLVDFVRVDDNRLSLNNTIVGEQILKQNNDKGEIIFEILSTISNRVYERDENKWYILFQCLLKVDILEDRLHIESDNLKKIFLKLKPKYKEISYFWLQFGIFEQSQGDYGVALDYLEKSASIRPKAFKIQHALARNYMRHANSLDNYTEAEPLFKVGETKMKQLIDSTNMQEQMVRPHSISCYVAEKIKFIKKFRRFKEPSNTELKYMVSILEYENPDEYLLAAFKKFYNLLESLGKTGIVNFAHQSPYFKLIRNRSEFEDELNDEDVDTFF